jgi:hypothetical protein
LFRDWTHTTFASINKPNLASSILNLVGKVPKVAFCTYGRIVYDDVHIYSPVTGALISTAKKLGILPECYPRPTFGLILIGVRTVVHALPKYLHA